MPLGLGRKPVRKKTDVMMVLGEKRREGEKGRRLATPGFDASSSFVFETSKDPPRAQISGSKKSWSDRTNSAPYFYLYILSFLIAGRVLLSSLDDLFQPPPDRGWNFASISTSSPAFQLCASKLQTTTSSCSSSCSLPPLCTSPLHQAQGREGYQ